MSEHAETIAKLIAELPPLPASDRDDLKTLLAPAVAAVLDRQPNQRTRQPVERRHAA